MTSAQFGPTIKPSRLTLGIISSTFIIAISTRIMETGLGVSFGFDRILSRVRNIISKAYRPLENNSTGLFEDFRCREKIFLKDWVSKADQNQNADEALPPRGYTICRMLLDAVKDSSLHINQLDNVITQLVDFKISFPTAKETIMTDNAVKVLKRLPERVRRYHEENEEETISRLHPAFFTQNTSARTSKTLAVTLFVPSSVLQLAVMVTLPVLYRQNWHGQATREFVDMISDCLETALTLKASEEENFDSMQLFVVRSFLWTLWHRALLLHRYYVLRIHLEFGYTYPVHRALDQRGLRVEEILRTQSEEYGETTVEDCKVPEKMNREALDLLRADPSAIGIHFGCLYHHFERATVDFPSAYSKSHIPECNGQCLYVRSDDEYLQFATRASAVALVPAQDTFLQYCEASTKTMCITTSWGQIEETGSNDGLRYSICWHKMFCALARENACNSYWVDTVCVPSSNPARKRTMGWVNSVFEKSKLTVIVDSSIMALEERGEQEEESAFMERALAALLVCDWNLEAWSLVAAVKGGRKLHVLCKNNKLQSVQSIIETVHQKGSVELATLSLLAYHFLKPSRYWTLSSTKTIFWSDNAAGFMRNRDTRGLSVEEAGRMLDYRRTNHTTDRLHIWCLLTGIPVVDTACEFWWHIQEIHTGYIFSHMPRISGTAEYSWAPAGPGLCNARRDLSLHVRQQLAWQYQQTEIANHISNTENHTHGSNAIWNFCSLEYFDVRKESLPMISLTLGAVDGLLKSRSEKGILDTLASLKEGLDPIPTDGEEWQVKNRKTLHLNKAAEAWNQVRLPAPSRRALLQIVKDYAPEGGHLALIYPQMLSSLLKNSTKTSSRLVGFSLAVISSEIGDQMEAKWRWLGIVEWDKGVQLPHFHERHITLV